MNADMMMENIRIIKERIAAAAKRAGRQSSDITLVAVSKTMPVESIKMAIHAGIVDFGENYYQETREKMPLLGKEIRWHFIGHLQTNKAKYIAGHFTLVHSVDSDDLAYALGKRAVQAGLIQPVLLEVKIDSAETKFGASPDETIDLAGRIASTPGLELKGLMGMAPYGDDPEQTRPHFAHLRKLFLKLPIEHRQILSMGMSGDFETAIEEGATLVRVGTAIFGHRS